MKPKGAHGHLAQNIEACAILEFFQLALAGDQHDCCCIVFWHHTNICLCFCACRQLLHQRHKSARETTKWADWSLWYVLTLKKCDSAQLKIGVPPRCNSLHILPLYCYMPISITAELELSHKSQCIYPHSDLLNWLLENWEKLRWGRKSVVDPNQIS